MSSSAIKHLGQLSREIVKDRQAENHGSRDILPYVATG
ncbi:hypothetical protein RD1_1218 [Roseobacter denitrificans OCh 114]|uniref:Uncharacterized protein n=1 Tax=Roseobacter denitrificans (strain ATCC 33942 / OCh 114) TaxID=375451 RepID=Q16AX6_ROSDO|nr:hypothetical protein RD1_1218 [Roseobacter denitrificans OCh 114]